MTNEELEQEVKRLEEQIIELRLKILESKGELIPYKPYEVEVPEDIEDYYTLDGYGKVYSLKGFSMNYTRCQYERGLAFKTREEAEQFKKEQILLFKMHKWAEEHNGEWTPNWEDDDEEKYTVRYDYEDNRFIIFYSHSYKEFSKLPCFISHDIAQQFVEEFKKEIIEVFC